MCVCVCVQYFVHSGIAGFKVWPFLVYPHFQFVSSALGFQCFRFSGLVDA